MRQEFSDEAAKSAIQAAISALGEGRGDEAERVYQALVGARPTSGEARMLGGIIAARTGRRTEAIERLQAALRLDPRLAAAHHWLAVLLLEDDRPAEALEHARVAQRVRPNDPQVLFNAAACLLAIGEPFEAGTLLSRAIAARPEEAPYHVQLARAFDALGQEGQAAKSLEEAVRIAPEFDTLLRLGAVLVKLGQAGRAVEAYSRALEAQPNSTEAHLAISRAYADLLRDDDAFTHADRAAEINPLLSSVPMCRAHLLQMRGHFQEAEEQLERALAIDPGLGVAYQNLVSARRTTAEDLPLAGRMREALRRPDLPPQQAANIHYALAKVMDDLGRFDEAMVEYDAANRIDFDARVKPYALDRVLMEAGIDSRIRAFNRAFLAGLGGQSQSDQPIFIVGLPRSGTTLIEQILSCHPDVAAAGELSFWAQAEPGIFSVKTSSVDCSRIPGFAADYLDLLDEFAHGRRYVTDKNPANCLGLGIIHAALPNARIVRAQRNAADTALSIYMTPWANPPDFACDKENIAFFSEQYIRLMTHWRNVLPGDRYLELRYEDLVSDPETHILRLLEFCGLEWNDACLHPEGNTRTVRTPSFWQVRQPLYRSSVKRWERYRPYLGPLERLIGLD